MYSERAAPTRQPRRRGTQWTSQSQPGKKPHYLATIDNGATTEELRFLAAAWAATGRTDAAAAVNRGLDYLLEAQYPSGGWPQVYPLEGGYHDHVTLNDDAMTNVLELLHDVGSEAVEFACVTPDRRERVHRALNLGINCLLAAQVPFQNRPSGWCGQYDPLTLEPAHGRAYEPPSLAGVESSHVLRFLMRLPDPSPEVVACI
jgi:PelA/Pel-15E family pectate lyase